MPKIPQPCACGKGDCPIGVAHPSPSIKRTIPRLYTPSLHDKYQNNWCWKQALLCLTAAYRMPILLEKQRCQ